MATALTTTSNHAEAFRAVAAQRLHEAADMTLYELVDEFQRLSKVIEASIADEKPHGSHFDRLTDAGKLAFRERQTVLAASKARFGIVFETFDHAFDGDSGW